MQVFWSVFVLIILYYLSSNGIRTYYYNRIIEKTPITRKEYQNIDKILTKFFRYYQRLNLRGKDRFVNRVFRFMKTKHFVSKKGQAITHELKIIIASSSVQITFGLKDYLLKNFHTIIMYPGIYYSEFI